MEKEEWPTSLIVVKASSAVRTRMCGVNSQDGSPLHPGAEQVQQPSTPRKGGNDLFTDFLSAPTSHMACSWCPISASNERLDVRCEGHHPREDASCPAGPFPLRPLWARTTPRRASHVYVHCVSQFRECVMCLQLSVNSPFASWLASRSQVLRCLDVEDCAIGFTVSS